MTAGSKSTPIPSSVRSARSPSIAGTLSSPAQMAEERTGCDRILGRDLQAVRRRSAGLHRRRAHSHRQRPPRLTSRNCSPAPTPKPRRSKSRPENIAYKRPDGSSLGRQRSHTSGKPSRIAPAEVLRCRGLTNPPLHGRHVVDVLVRWNFDQVGIGSADERFHPLTCLVGVVDFGPGVASPETASAWIPNDQSISTLPAMLTTCRRSVNTAQ